jgi:hypothetical protein
MEEGTILSNRPGLAFEPTLSFERLLTDKYVGRLEVAAGLASQAL